MTHIIKLQEGFCDAVLSGNKCFEIRLNDRGYQKGDYVIFKPIRKDGVEIAHPVNECKYEITYVLGGWGLQDGYVVFGIKKVSNEG